MTVIPYGPFRPFSSTPLTGCPFPSPRAAPARYSARGPAAPPHPRVGVMVRSSFPCHAAQACARVARRAVCVCAAAPAPPPCVARAAAAAAHPPPVPHLVRQPHTKSRAYGMYDSVYQISARNWTMIMQITAMTFPT